MLIVLLSMNKSGCIYLNRFSISDLFLKKDPNHTLFAQLIIPLYLLGCTHGPLAQWQRVWLHIKRQSVRVTLGSHIFSLFFVDYFEDSKIMLVQSFSKQYYLVGRIQNNVMDYQKKCFAIPVRLSTIAPQGHIYNQASGGEW